MVAAPTTSATPTERAGSTTTRAMFRKDFAQPVSSDPTTTSTRPRASRDSSAVAALRVEGSS